MGWGSPLSSSAPRAAEAWQIRQTTPRSRAGGTSGLAPQQTARLEPGSQALPRRGRGRAPMHAWPLHEHSGQHPGAHTAATGSRGTFGQELRGLRCGVPWRPWGGLTQKPAARTPSLVQLQRPPLLRREGSASPLPSSSGFASWAGGEGSSPTRGRGLLRAPQLPA